jgi:hypothetical protein
MVSNLIIFEDISQKMHILDRKPNSSHCLQKESRQSKRVSDSTTDKIFQNVFHEMTNSLTLKSSVTLCLGYT